MSVENNETIYDALANYQSSGEWDDRNSRDIKGRKQLFTELHRWADLFRFEFKLDIPKVVIVVRRLRPNRYGQFRYGCNGMGLRREITINDRYVGTRTDYELLGTLCHELLHAWQEDHGRPGRSNYHNVEFRKRAADLGLIVNRYGVTTYRVPSPFADLIAQHGVVIPNLASELPGVNRDKGTSKLALWTCECPVRLRVGKAEVHVRCLDCGQVFQKSGN